MNTKNDIALSTAVQSLTAMNFSISKLETEGMVTDSENMLKSTAMLHKLKRFQIRITEKGIRVVGVVSKDIHPAQFNNIERILTQMMLLLADVLDRPYEWTELRSV